MSSILFTTRENGSSIVTVADLDLNGFELPPPYSYKPEKLMKRHNGYTIFNSLLHENLREGTGGIGNIFRISPIEKQYWKNVDKKTKKLFTNYAKEDLLCKEKR